MVRAAETNVTIRLDGHPETAGVYLYTGTATTTTARAPGFATETASAPAAP